MSRLLIARCSSIREELIQRQRNSCAWFDNWTKHISGSLEELKSNTYIRDMVLTLDRRLSSTSMPVERKQSAFLWDNLQHADFPAEIDSTISLETSTTAEFDKGMNSPDLGSSAEDQPQEDQQHSPYYVNFTWTQN